MTRGIGERAILTEFLPEWMALLAAALTQLGDGWFIILLFASTLLAFPDHRAGIVAVFGAWLAGIGLYSGLKSLFALPRPPTPIVAPETVPAVVEPFYTAIATPGGYGFPSGHAVNATIVYVGLAAVLPIWTRRRRLLVGGTLAVTVCLTRVVLGVHYLVDVIAGAFVAGTVLVAVWTLDRWRPHWRSLTGFVLVFPITFVFMVLNGPGQRLIGLTVLASLGILISYRYFGLADESLRLSS